MSLQVPDTTYQAILANPRNSQKLTLAALRSLSRAPIAFLLRIECDPLTPDKLRFALVQRREAVATVLAVEGGVSNEPFCWLPFCMILSRIQTPPSQNSKSIEDPDIWADGNRPDMANYRRAIWLQRTRIAEE
jgi:hypothetical protein